MVRLQDVHDRMNVLAKGQILQTRHGSVSSLNFEAKLQVFKKDLFGRDFMIKVTLKTILFKLKKKNPQNKQKFPKRF